MLNLCLPMKVINITQHSGSNFSHPNGALDLAGSDAGVDFAFALGNYWRCIAGPWGSNTYFFTASDAKGNPVTVHCADGVNRIVTVAMTHSNLRYNKPIIGKVYSDGEAIYEEGTAGQATGNHIHFEVAEGLHYSKTKDYNLNVYRMPNELKPEDVCFICDSFSKVKSMGGVTMKHCDTPYYETQDTKPVLGTLRGIDISNWQASMDVAAVSADFVILKASEGVDWKDPAFDTLLEKVKKTDKLIGFYHFARPTANNTPEAEAESFLKFITPSGLIGKAILALDWEAENKQNVAYAKAWLDYVYNKTGVKPWIYMSESVTKNYDWSSVANAGYPLWVAKYRDKSQDYNYDMTNAGTAPQVNYWNNYIMWQWTGVGRLDSYNGDIDCNLFYGTADTWRSLAAPVEDELAQYTDLELAHMVLENKFGTGEERKKALGDRYKAVQLIVNQLVKEQQEQKPSIDVGPVVKYSIQYNGLTVHIAKIKKDQEIRGSVDGNRYGVKYDKTVPAGFSDKDLLNAGYQEACAQNGSTFYSWNGATYAEGIEISKGINNQDFYMDAVSKFNSVMAIGFPYTGGIVFAPQKEIVETYSRYYGAVTGIFGIIYEGKQNAMGSSINRNGGFTVKSGRSILAEDEDYYYSICFVGDTGSTGLTGKELYNLCITVSKNMINAICFDGGGSVFQRIEGEYTINTTRQVKNGIMLFIKDDESTSQEPKDETPVNPLDKYSDEELADMVLDGKFGSGDARKEALGNRYIAVQTIVNIRVINAYLRAGDKIRIKNNAKDLNTGTTYIKSVYLTVYKVKEISENRVVFGTDNAIIGVVSKDNIILE